MSADDVVQLLAGVLLGLPLGALIRDQLNRREVHGRREA